MQKSSWKAVLPAFLVLAALVTLFLLPAGAARAEPPTGLDVVASDLRNPRGLVFDDDGNLHIAEAGRGGPEPCVIGPEGEICYGPTGRVTTVMTDGTVMTHTTELVSLAEYPTGTAAIGPQGIAMDGNGMIHLLVGLGLNPLSRTQIGPPGANFGQLVMAHGTWSNVEDIAQYEVDENPDGAELDSNPFGLLALDDGWLVTDAGANALLHVDSTGVISTVTWFPEREVPHPFIPGAFISMDPVPTAVTMGPDGAYYVGELTGFPFPVGGARVYRVDPTTGISTTHATGFTNIMGLAFDGSGNLFVLEMARNGLLQAETDPTGRIVRVAPNGSQTVVMEQGLVLPTGMTYGPDDMLYVSNFGIFAAPLTGGPPTGMVIRVDPMGTTAVELSGLEGRPARGVPALALALLALAAPAALVALRRRR